MQSYEKKAERPKEMVSFLRFSRWQMKNSKGNEELWVIVCLEFSRYARYGLIDQSVRWDGVAVWWVTEFAECHETWQNGCKVSFSVSPRGGAIWKQKSLSGGSVKPSERDKCGLYVLRWDYQEVIVAPLGGDGGTFTW